MEFVETEPTNKSAIQGTHELTVCQTTEKIHTWKLNEQQQQLVDASGLSNLIHTAGLVIDRVALMAFFEQWSKETNTAQFNGFEMAPSLRDVAYILGVPVTGRVVTTGAVLNKSVEELCFQYLGQVPDCRDCRGSHVKLSWLQSKFSRLSERPTDDEVMYSTRAYVLFLIGSALLPERDRGYVSPKYLPLLSDFEKVQEYAWGAAALAHLYKALSLAVAHSARKRLFDSAALLMGWLYEYIPALRPDMDDPPVHIFPRVLKWTGSTISQQTKNVSVIRKAFSLLQVSDVNWKPYEGVDPASVPKHCVAPDNLCFSRTWLVSFNLKEIYAPDRFARQFGQEQHHPLNDVPAFQRHLWNPAVDWSLMYASEIQRFQQLINAADDGDHAHTSMPATCVGGAAAAAAADVFTPATMARASLGLSLITVVEGVREELPTVARFLEQRRGLPAALATSLSRIRGLIEASPPAPLKRGDAAPQPQPIVVIPPPVMMPAREAQAAVGDGTRTAPHGAEDAEAPGIVSDDAAVPPKERSDEQRRQEEEEEAAAKGSGGGAVRRSSRSCVQAKRFRRVGGKGSRSSDPIVL